MRPPKWMRLSAPTVSNGRATVTVTIRHRSLGWLRFLNGECKRLRPDIPTPRRWRLTVAVWLRGHS